MAETRELTQEELTKVRAETEKVLVEKARLEAETEKLKEEARKANIDANAAAIAFTKLEREEKRILADNEYHNVYTFTSDVNDNSVQTCMKTLNVWRRNNPGCDIELVFSSPGGGVLAGMALYDYLQMLRREGHKITTVCLGMAASMAGILLQAGDVRAVGKESYILIHQIATMAYGKIGDIEDEVVFINMIQDRVIDIFAERARQANANGTAAHPLTKAQFKKKWERKDWWVSSDQALDWGIVDKVL